MAYAWKYGLMAGWLDRWMDIYVDRSKDWREDDNIKVQFIFIFHSLISFMLFSKQDQIVINLDFDVLRNNQAEICVGQASFFGCRLIYSDTKQRLSVNLYSLSYIFVCLLVCLLCLQIGFYYRSRENVINVSLCTAVLSGMLCEVCHAWYVVAFWSTMYVFYGICHNGFDMEPPLTFDSTNDSTIAIAINVK